MEKKKIEQRRSKNILDKQVIISFEVKKKYIKSYRV